MHSRIAGRTLISRLMALSCIVLGAATATPAQPSSDAGGPGTPPGIGIAKPPDKGEYFGERLPGETPVPFAPEILAALSPWVEATAFSPDGRQFFASIGSANYGSAKLYCSERHGEAWTPFVPAAFAADFVYSNEPVFSRDGAALTFTGQKAGGTIDLWTVQKTEQGWGTPVALPPPVNSSGKDYRSSVGSDGTMYWCSDRSGMMQIYKAHKDAAQKWSAEMMGAPINAQSYEGDPCIAPDGHYLVFNSGRDGRSSDLYVSFRDGKGNWGPPINLGDAFNGPDQEYGAHLSSDGKVFFFTRHSAKGNVIYWVDASAIDKLMAQNTAGKAAANASADPGSPSYAIPGKPSEMVQNHEAVLALALQVEKDLKVLVQQATPQDRASLVPINSMLFTISLLKRDFVEGRRYLEAVRELQAPGTAKLLTGLITGPYMQAMVAPGADFHAAYRAALTQHLAGLPYNDVEGSLKAVKDSVAAASKAQLVDSVAAGLDPAVKDGRLGQAMAGRLLSTAMNIEVVLPVKDDIVAAIQSVMDASKPAEAAAPAKAPTIGPLKTPIRGAYWGQATPGETPVLFAADILPALNAWVEGVTFSPDGNLCLMCVGDANYTSGDLYLSKRVNDTWTTLEKAPFVSGFALSGGPAFSADGTKVTFMGKKPGGTEDLWTVSYDGTSWGTPVALPFPINTGEKEFPGSYMSDGTMYFSRAPSGLASQIYRANKIAAHPLVAEPLGAPINQQAYDGDPCIAPDGRWLVFYSARAGGFGGTDLYVSFSDGHGGWKRPINLGAGFNGPTDEYGAHLSSDGKVLFFTRHTPQGNGIFWADTSAIDKLASAETADPKGPYFGQRPPGETPEPFAPEFLSARYGFVARIAFSPDGTECFFTVTDATYSHPKILGTRRTGDLWSEPASPTFADPQWINHEPFFSQDGTKLFFTSNREAQPATNKRDFWMVERTATGWSEPKRLPPPVNSDFTEFFYSQAADGTVYFCSSRPGGIGAIDLYRVRQVPGQPARAENLGAQINSPYSTGDPCIAADGRFLVFSAARDEGLGGSDLYVSFRDGSGGWTAPVNLGKGFNTAANEYAPSLSPDERYLFFTRHDGKRADLQWVLTSTLERFRPDAQRPTKSSG